MPIIRLSSNLERLEQVLNAVRGERRLTKDTHDLEHWPVNLKVVLDDGNEAVGDDGDVNLYAHSILGCSLEPLDLEMLFDPFEELYEKLHISSLEMVSSMQESPTVNTQCLYA